MEVEFDPEVEKNEQSMGENSKPIHWALRYTNPF